MIQINKFNYITRIYKSKHKNGNFSITALHICGFLLLSNLLKIETKWSQSYHLWSTYCMLGSIVEAFYKLPDLILLIVLWGRHSPVVFIDEVTASGRSSSLPGDGSSIESRSSWFQNICSLFLHHLGHKCHVQQITSFLSFFPLFVLHQQCFCLQWFPGGAEMRQFALVQILLRTLGNHVSSGKLLNFSKPQFHHVSGSGNSTSLQVVRMKWNKACRVFDTGPVNF